MSRGLTQIPINVLDFEAPAIVLSRLNCVICGVITEDGGTGSLFPLSLYKMRTDRPDASPHR